MALKIISPYIAKRSNRKDPYNTTALNGNFMIPAAIQEIEKGKGRRAPTTIKNPPHFFEFLSCFYILTSK